MFPVTDVQQVKLKSNGVLVPAELRTSNGRRYLHFGYNKGLIAEIKSTFEDRKWHGFENPPQKVWSIPVDSEHNDFQLDYLTGKDPYAHYKKPVIQHDLPRKELRQHQVEGVNFQLTRRHAVIVGEMGIGKTLMSIAVSEYVQFGDFWYIAPKSALSSARLDYVRWNAKYIPEFMTYEALTKRMLEWETGNKPPRMVVFDEASRLKNAGSKRSQAAYHLSKAIRKEYGYESIIMLMTGSPAPKSPLDWWSLLRVARPGYLKEGSIAQFQNRYALLKAEDYGTGAFNRLVTWKDNERKCGVCGEVAEHINHAESNPDFDHMWEPMPNEVGKLYNRMSGAIWIKLKKDCLDLPDKVYRLVQCDVDNDTKRAAALIKRGAKSTIEALTRLRELSDGFQYIEEQGPKETCSFCNGAKVKPNGDVCEPCSGSGYTKTFVRRTVELPCAKDDALEEILENCHDTKRCVVYAGFTASIDRVQRVCMKLGWTIIRLDGQGCKTPFGDLDSSVKAFQNPQDYTDNIVFIGHPESAGMGLTLTASDTIVYFSNDFKAENRIQSEDRIHRMGMDVNRGANIIDLIGLDSDLFVLKNLRKKRELQSITLGELAEASITFDDLELR